MNKCEKRLVESFVVDYCDQLLLEAKAGPPDSDFIPESARENQRWKDRVIEKMQGSAVLAKVTVDGRKACS